MSETPTPSPNGADSGKPAGEPELLTLPEAAVLTGLSTKALSHRVQRGTLPSELHHGRRLVRRGELQRLRLAPAENPDGEGALTRWEARYDEERAAHEQTRAERDRLAQDLAAIANAGPIRAFKLKRAVRARLSA